MKARWCVVIIVSLVISRIAVSPMLVMGEMVETVNDVLGLYGKSKVGGVKELYEQYVDVKSSYDLLQMDVSAAESFNKAYTMAEDFQKKKKQEIEEQIKEILEKNTTIANNIKNELSGAWETLVNLDAEYRINLEKMNALLSEQSEYVLPDRRSINYDRLSELKSETGNAKKKYEKSISVNQLGQVTGVKLPFDGKIDVYTQYGYRIDPIGKSSVKYHAGLDFKMEEGTPVKALFHGVVTGTGYEAVGGYFVRIEHGGGLVTTYQQLSEIRCVAGQKINQQDEIALSGRSGSAVIVPHLHLGVYINGCSVDPEVLLSNSIY